MCNPDQPPSAGDAKWYAATVILRRTVNGEEIGPIQPSQPHRKTPVAQRQVYLIRAVTADAAYEQAVEIGKRRYFECNTVEGYVYTWEFAGLEDLALIEGEPGAPECLVWCRCAYGLPAADFVCDKEELSVFSEDRGWYSRKPEHYAEF